jgi:hypothetical protein
VPKRSTPNLVGVEMVPGAESGSSPMSAEMSAADRRAARKEKLAEAEAQQFEADLAELDKHEIALGDSNVTHVRVPFVPGTPVLAIARAPKPLELKRYRDRLKEEKPDRVAAAEELAASVRLYPEAGAYAAMCAARPGLHAQLGVASLELSVGKAAADNKSG